MAFFPRQPARNDKIAVGTSSVVILEALADQTPRKSFSIRNTSSADADIISLTFGSELAVANEGVVLNRNEIWQESSEQDNPCWQAQVTAICATANGQLTIMER